MLTVIACLVVLGGVGLLAAWLKTALAAHEAESGAQLTARNAEIDRHLQAVVETMDRRLGLLDGKVDRRLESASKTTSQIHERLGKVDEATGQMLARAKDLASSTLPRRSWIWLVVDAVIKVEKLVPVDAKF